MSNIFNLAENGKVKELKKLLAKEPDKINTRANSGWTALMLAANNSKTTSSLETVKTLLEAGADPNIQNIHGWTALMYAAKYSNSASSLETVKTLLKAGADPNIRNNDEWTALMFAAKYSNSISSLETVKTLLKAGTDPFLKNNRGKTAFDLCPTPQCKQLLSSKNIWKIWHDQDQKLASEAHKANPGIDKNVFLYNILMRRRQQELCQDLSNAINQALLFEFAKTLNLNVTEETSKQELCSLISKQLSEGNRIAPIKKR